MEDYLLECLEFLQRAGNDVGRRRKEVQTPQVWSLLPFEWKALAILAASKAAPARLTSSLHRVPALRSVGIGRGAVDEAVGGK